MAGVFFPLLILAGVAVLTAGVVLTLKRRDAAQATAARLGLEYETGDPLRLLDIPARLFQRGDRRRMGVTIHGTMDGRTVALCDYVYYDVTRDGQGHSHETSHWMSLAIVTLRSPLPGFQLLPESIGRKLLNLMSLGKDVQFESEEFNRRFTVLSEDRDFAFTLVDPSMMEWLMDGGTGWALEIVLDRLIVAMPRVSWEETSRMLDTAFAFESHFPRLVWELYGVER